MTDVTVSPAIAGTPVYIQNVFSFLKNKKPSEKAELMGKDIAKQIINLGLIKILFDKV